MNVLVISKGGLFADALRHWLQALFPDTQVGLCGPATISHYRDDNSPRFALIDIDELPKRRLRTGMKKFRERLPGTCLVAVGSPNGKLFAASLIGMGADAYLPKSHGEIKALAVISQALKRKSDATGTAVAFGNGQAAGIRPLLVKRVRGSSPYGLTPRELDMLELACFGLSNFQIAQHHKISAGVVKLHLHSAYEKLGVQGRVQAIRIVEHMDAIQALHLQRMDSADALLDCLLPHMAHEHHRKGRVLFRKGEPGQAMYYVQKGRVHLPELDVNMTEGETFGELGVFAPTHIRTSSARCESDTHLFKLTAEQTQRLCFENPRFAYYMIRLIAERLVGERANGAKSS
jgi:two-component system nitrate/nitrite response regulator NarL